MSQARIESILLGPAGGSVLVSRRRVRRIATCIIVINALVWFLSVATARQGRTFLGPGLGGDFACFYSAGAILNEGHTDHLYDVWLQSRHYHALFPAESPEAALPYAYPPVVAEVFRPLALLPYPAAVVIWTGISSGLYLGGLALLWQTCTGISRDDRWLAMLLSLAFEPFIVECLHGGQLSALGFVLVCAAIWLDRAGKPIASGVALGLCLYKPTLLPMVLPMLLMGRRWRTLVGVVAGGLGLVASSAATTGWIGLRQYVHVLTTYGHQTAASDTFFRTWKFVDLNSFTKLLIGTGSPWLGVGVMIAATLVAVPLLYRVLAGYTERGPDTRGPAPLKRGRRDPIPSLAWCTAIAASLVLNLYVGIYDTILIVPVLWLLSETSPRTRLLRNLLVAIFIAPWFSQDLAMHTGFQPFTLILAIVAAYPFINGCTTAEADLPSAPS